MFDRITFQDLLHKSQMNIMTASLPSFKEVFMATFEEKAQCYFQFRFIFNGMSFCTLDFPSFKNSIKNLRNAMHSVKIDHTKIIGDSALYKMLDYSTDKMENQSRNVIIKFFDMLNIQPQMSFMANWNYETFIQVSLDNNYIRPLFFILDYLLDHTDDAQFKHILIHDFPQLIS